MDAQPASQPSSTGIRATYPTRQEAEAAAPRFGCQGAHRMGDQWMPCAVHSHGTHPRN
ncbi:MAG: DUF3721 domain-containing protein [Synechococcus sp.]|nr:DUF3721 domain-containing protein [Synechococcus sp.]